MPDFWDTQKIIEWINEFSLSAYREFYPSAPAKDLEMNPNKVFESLLYLVKNGMLNLFYEKRCPQCGSKICEDEIDGLVYCDYCDDNIEAIEDMIFPKFSVCNNYRDEIKKNKKVGNRNLLLSYAKKRLNQYL